MENKKIFKSIVSVRLKLDYWVLISALILALVFLPILTIIYLSFFPSDNIWPHLLSTSLPRYFSNSVTIMAMVGMTTAIIGSLSAWLVVHCNFPMRRFFEWMLLLPLAVPAYIGAYALVDFWEYAGPAQTALRGWFGWQTPQDYAWFPEPRSRSVAVFVISMSLYPYVYLLARSAFKEQSQHTKEVARTLGAGAWKRFWKLTLPLARPAIIVGVALVMMEALNDFATVEFFAVQTLTTGIFTIWLERSNVGGAAQISLVIFGLILLLLLLEHYNRRSIKVHQKAMKPTPIIRYNLSFLRAVMAIIFCALPVVFGFVMPVAIMARHAHLLWQKGHVSGLGHAALSSFWLGVAVAFITVLAGLILLISVKNSRSRLPQSFAAGATIGYAAPGAILAVGVMIPLAKFDHMVADIIERFTLIDIGLLFTGTSSAIIFALSVRFFALAYGALDSGIDRFSPNIPYAARSLGAGRIKILRGIYLPILRPSLMIAFLLVFVDSIKELPATLLLRPFGFETLATQIYNAASIEDIQGASLASLLVITVGVCAVFAIAKMTR